MSSVDEIMKLVVCSYLKMFYFLPIISSLTPKIRLLLTLVLEKYLCKKFSITPPATSCTRQKILELDALFTIDITNPHARLTRSTVYREFRNKIYYFSNFSCSCHCNS